MSPLGRSPQQPTRSLKRLRTHKPLRHLLVWGLAFSAVIVVLLFVPWRQSVTGTGRVTVFSPMQRPQNIEAQIPGQIAKWHVREGQYVKSGELLADLSDIDAKFLGANQVNLLVNQKKALQARRQATQSRIAALENQMRSLTGSRNAALPAAAVKTGQNRDRIIASEQALEATRQNAKTAQYNFDRLKTLYDKGLRSRRDYELAELDRVRAETEVRRAETALTVSRKDVNVASFDQVKVDTDTTAALATVMAAIATAQETLSSTDSDLAKLEVDIQNLNSRVEQRHVRAPITGRVVRLISLGAGETVTEGDILATVVPETTDQAVELYVSDWDAPLITPGRPVRLQFSGFPAIQFSGWPSVASGTFGGQVAVIDATDDGKGRYRILIKPARHRGQNDEFWPKSDRLRPGTAAQGWILLGEVPLWYELWRQFNGFRPIVDPDAGAGGDKTDEKADKKKPIKRKSKK